MLPNPRVKKVEENEERKENNIIELARQEKMKEFKLLKNEDLERIIIK